jgi:predicted dehydrogenase
MKKLKIAVAGLGRTGWRNHLANLAKLPDLYEICGVCDAMDSRRKEAESTFGCASYANIESMLREDGIDWVVVATPQILHHEQTIAALRAGKNVVCEKPMAVNSAQAEEMAAAASETGRHLTVFHNLRYAPDFALVRKVISTGKLGRILMVKIHRNDFSRRWDWQTLKKFGGGNLANQGPHVLDHALCLMNTTEPGIVARAEAAVTLGDADDHVKILLHAKSSPLVDIEISSADATGADRWKVYGTSGGLVGDGVQFRYKYFDPDELPERTVQETPPLDRTYNSETIPWREESLSLTEAEVARPLPLDYYSDLHRAICSGNPPPISTAHALAIMRLMDRVWETAI